MTNQEAKVIFATALAKHDINNRPSQKETKTILAAVMLLNKDVFVRLRNR